MLLHNTSAQREPEARPTQSARVGSIALLESIEDPLQLLLRDAAPLVLDAERHLPFARRLSRQPDRRVRERKFQRVNHKLVQHLQNTLFIGIDLRGRCVDAKRDPRMCSLRISHVGSAAAEAPSLPRAGD